MEETASIPEHGALLVAEIGPDTTNVALIDLVDESYRLIARATSPSTFGPPDNDPTKAIIAAVQKIEQITARELLRGEDLAYPQDDAGNGVDGLVATTSAAGTLSVAVAGLSRHASVRSATHAARSTYTTLLETIALDEGGTQLGRHIAALAYLNPDVIVFAGGQEGGNVSANQRLAHIVGLLAQHSTQPPLVVFAGNSAAADQVRQHIGDGVSIEVMPNVLPLPGQPQLEPTRALLRRRYAEQIVSALPGAERLRMLRNERLGSVAEDQGLMVRFLAQRFNRNVLAVNTDSATTACLLASNNHYSEAIFGRLGTRFGALAVLEQRGSQGIQRWLPFELEAEDLAHRLLNRAIRPHQVATDLDDLLLDYALMREAIGIAYQALRDERKDAQFDLVIAGGSMVDAPRPGLAALALLDGLQPTYRDSELAINLYLDQWSLLAASGALAHINTDAAVCLLEMDMLNNMPLATVIVPRGELAAGKKMAEVELTPLQGTPITRTVHAGEIVRLPLARGKRATLRIRPVGGIAIGQNQAGTEVLSDEAAIVGSALGVIIDARPRPLALPDDLQQRRQLLLRWMDALDALPPETAYAPTQTTNAAASATNGAAATEAQSEPTNGAGADPVGVVSSSDDVAALREGLVLQPQPKRGFFRRK